MAVARQEEQTDSLKSLEERIGRAVEMVVELRKENQELAKRIEAMQAERDDARTEAQMSAAHSEKLNQELEELRSERKQVRARIEKLLGQMDLFSAT
jgi:FtsZ-binding cell division protein ZapB